MLVKGDDRSGGRGVGIGIEHGRAFVRLWLMTQHLGRDQAVHAGIGLVQPHTAQFLRAEIKLLKLIKLLKMLKLLKPLKMINLVKLNKILKLLNLPKMLKMLKLLEMRKVVLLVALRPV